MLDTRKALGRIVILVMDVEITVLYSFTGFLRKKIIVNKRFCSLACKLHHHACRRIRVHIGILTGDVIAFGLDDFKEHVAGLGSAGYRPLIAICDVTFGDFLSRRIHELKLDIVLNFFNRHLFTAGHAYTIGNTRNESFILAHFCCEHSLADCGLDFFFIVTDDSAIALYHCQYHNCLFFVRGLEI